VLEEKKLRSEITQCPFYHPIRKHHSYIKWIYGTVLLFMGDNLFHEYCIHQLRERENLAIKLTTPAICLSTIDDDFFYVRCDFVT
jgi:hypothetical protein